MIDFSTLDVRDLIFLAVVLVAIYVVLVLLRLLQLGWNQRRAAALVGPEGRSGDRAFFARAEPAGEAQRNEAQWEPAVRSATTLTDAKDSVSVHDFAAELARSSLDLEVKQLRCEIAQLGTEMTHLAEEMRNLKMVRNVSPLYGEAMTLARQGEPPARIAAQCGISVGEAELVAALASREP